MNLPVNQQHQLIKKYYQLLVEEYIKDPAHKNYKIVFKNDLGSSKKFQNLGHTN
jgi:hypothetical protein